MLIQYTNSRVVSCKLKFNELSISGCWVGQLEVHSDNRGDFYEWHQNLNLVENIGNEFVVAQANCSKSKSGVLRGIHFTSQNPGQSKLVTVMAGQVLDLLIDLRKNSPTFLKHEVIVLDSHTPTTVFIPWGVGHAYLSLNENTIFSYLCDKPYDPENEFDLNALDPNLNIRWPSGIKFIQSQKDKNAPYLESIFEKLPE